MRRWNNRIFRKRLGRIAVLFCLAVLLAGCIMGVVSLLGFSAFGAIAG